MTDATGSPVPLDGAGGKVPVWVKLIPVGTFKGMDGRGPYHADVKAVAASSQARLPAPVDYVHQTQTAADKGQPAPAAGWIVAMEARADGVWGQVEWTPAGRRALANKEYRFLSPVFAHAKGSGEVLRLLGAGLVNNPNIMELPILNSAQREPPEGAPVQLTDLLRRDRDQRTPNPDAIMVACGLPLTPSLDMEQA